MHHGDSKDGAVTHGAYDQLSWKIYSGKRATTLDSTTASLHELFHAELDQSTDFGTVLCCTAQLAKSCMGKDRLRFRRLLTRLLTICEATHETYATFSSSLLRVLSASLRKPVPIGISFLPAAAEPIFGRSSTAA
jgi:hypothetical protein